MNRFQTVCFLGALVTAGCAGGNRSDNNDSPDLKKAGSLDGGGGAKSAIVINEINPNGPDEATDPDWIELKNTGTTAVDLSAWQIRDNDVAHLATFGGGTLQPGAYLVIKCDDGIGGGVAFKLSGSGGDEVHLVDEKGNTVDSTTYAAGAVADGQSWGRSPDGVGVFSVLSTLTKGAANP